MLPEGPVSLPNRSFRFDKIITLRVLGAFAVQNKGGSNLLSRKSQKWLTKVVQNSKNNSYIASYLLIYGRPANHGMINAWR